MPSLDSTSEQGEEGDLPDSSLVGCTLGDRYRLEEHLASGAHGDVLAAFDRREERRVAIKLLSPETQSDHPRAVARMRQEAQILKVLEHPNLVRVYDIDSDDRGTFLVMELLEGRTLEDIMAQEGTASAERVRPIAAQLLRALGAMHDRGIHHRDIKPDNVLLSEGEEGEYAKLFDLGIAQADNDAFDPDRDVTLVETQGGAFLGTPRYASPEQAVGDPIQPSTDLFSLGLVLAEWFRGEPLIDSSKRRGALSALVHPEPFDLSGCPDDWRPWLETMVAKAPSERFQSAEAALDRLPGLEREDSNVPTGEPSSSPTTTLSKDSLPEGPDAPSAPSSKDVPDSDALETRVGSDTIPDDPDSSSELDATIVSERPAPDTEDESESIAPAASTLETDISTDDLPSVSLNESDAEFSDDLDVSETVVSPKTSGRTQPVLSEFSSDEEEDSALSVPSPSQIGGSDRDDATEGASGGLPSPDQLDEHAEGSLEEASTPPPMPEDSEAEEDASERSREEKSSPSSPESHDPSEPHPSSRVQTEGRASEPESPDAGGIESSSDVETLDRDIDTLEVESDVETSEDAPPEESSAPEPESTSPSPDPDSNDTSLEPTAPPSTSSNREVDNSKESYSSLVYGAMVAALVFILGFSLVLLSWSLGWL